MKKREKAIAIRYDSDKDDAPRVIAKGEGIIAEKIKEIANNKDIPIYENKELVEQMLKIDLNDEIPFELYEVMAQILAFVYNIKNEYKNSKT